MSTLRDLLQLSEGMVDKAKGIFYKALQHIPWVKVNSHTRFFPPYRLPIILDMDSAHPFFAVLLNPGFLPGWSAAVSRANPGVFRLDDRERAPAAAASGRAGYTAGVVKWTRLTLCKCDVMFL